MARQAAMGAEVAYGGWDELLKVFAKILEQQ